MTSMANVSIVKSEQGRGHKREMQFTDFGGILVQSNWKFSYIVETDGE
jgi:hypothetical protein